MHAIWATVSIRLDLTSKEWMRRVGRVAGLEGAREMPAPPGGARFYRRSRELRARTRASVHFLSRHPALSIFSFSLVTTGRTRVPPPRYFHARCPVCACQKLERSRNPATRRRNATADKDASHRLYATAPFARMRFFHRLAPSICRDFRPFSSRETAPFRTLVLVDETGQLFDCLADQVPLNFRIRLLSYLRQVP